MSLYSLYEVLDDSDSGCNTETPHHLQNLVNIRKLGEFTYLFEPTDQCADRIFYRGLNVRDKFVYFFVIDGVRYGISKEHLDYYWCEK